MMIRNFIAIVAMLSMMTGCENLFGPSSTTPTSGATSTSANTGEESPATTAVPTVVSDEVGTAADQPSDNAPGTVGSAVDNDAFPASPSVPNVDGANTVSPEAPGSSSPNTNNSN